MWPFRKHPDPVELRLSGHSSDILVLYQRLYQLELSLATLNKKILVLENILKNNKVCITIMEKGCDKYYGGC